MNAEGSTLFHVAGHDSSGREDCEARDITAIVVGTIYLSVPLQVGVPRRYLPYVEPSFHRRNIVDLRSIYAASVLTAVLMNIHSKNLSAYRSRL